MLIFDGQMIFLLWFCLFRMILPWLEVFTISELLLRLFGKFWLHREINSCNVKYIFLASLLELATSYIVREADFKLHPV